jgi:hypothetical protein
MNASTAPADSTSAGLGPALRWAVVGTCAAVLFMFLYLGDATPLSLVTPGNEGPSAAVFEKDFPTVDLPPGVGHDGQQTYAMARHPWSPEASAADLDRPRYRWQRPILPLVAGTVAAGANGGALIVALIVTNVAALFVGALSVGLIARRFGGPAWAGAFVPLVPGAWNSLVMTTSDGLAYSFVLAAIGAALSRRLRWAALFAAIAVLGKESTWMFLATAAVMVPQWRRSLALVPALVGGTWWVALRLFVADDSEGVKELVAPFSGWAKAVPWWQDGYDRQSPVFLLITIAVVVGVVLKYRRHPLCLALATQLVFLAFLHVDVIGPRANVTRATTGLWCAVIVVLATGSRWTSSGVIATVRRSLDTTPSKAKANAGTSTRP